MLVSLVAKDITGKDADAALGNANITVNKNAVPNDPRSPFVTSGLRVGTPAITTRGFGPAEVRELTGWICDILDDLGNEVLIQRVRGQLLDVTGEQMDDAEQFDDVARESQLEVCGALIDVVTPQEARVDHFATSQAPVLLQVAVLQFRRNEGDLFLDADRGELFVAIEGIDPPTARAGSRWKFPSQQLEQRTFAGTIPAEDGPMLAGMQLPVDVAKDLVTLQDHVQSLESDQWRVHLNRGKRA
jgi:hypothetical protein